MILGAAYRLLTGRDPRWPKGRREHLAANPDCVVCGKLADTVHHVEPVHVNPAREMDPTNWASVCDDCHFCVGHRRDWRDWVTNFWPVARAIRTGRGEP